MLESRDAVVRSLAAGPGELQHLSDIGRNAHRSLDLRSSVNTVQPQIHLPSVSILLLEANAADVEPIRAHLGKITSGLTLDYVATEEQFRTALDMKPYDAVISGHALPQFDSFSALEFAHQRFPGMPFILLSGTIDEEHVVEALRHGATDYVAKQRLERLVPVVSRALNEARERKANQAFESRLQESQQLRIALDTAQLGTWEMDLASREIICSEQCKANFGQPADAAFTYAALLACILPEDRPAMEKSVAQALEQKTTYHAEYRVRWPDGSEHRIVARGRGVEDQHGQVRRVVGVTMDVTEQHGVERDRHWLLAQLRAEQSRLQAIIEQMPAGLIIAEAATGKVIIYNQAAERILGHPVLPGSQVESYAAYGGLHPNGTPYQPEEYPTARALLQGEIVQQEEFQYRKGDGSITTLSVTAAPLRDAESRITGAVCTFLDVAERKRAEEAASKQAQELARSNADLQQFAYVTSHDLQEPLRTITSFAQLLNWQYQGRLDADADQFLGYITAGALRMKSLIDALLSYSRVVNVEVMPVGPVELERALHWAVMNLQTVISETGALISNDPLPIVQGDHVQLVQLLQNLVGNAIKYRSAQTPHIHISAQRQNADGQPSAEVWQIAVRDNGIGIPPKYTERIFGVFKRLHGQEVPGTGIGLAICKRIVERHDGRLWVSSQVGEGSTFLFTLPGVPEQPA